MTRRRLLEIAPGFVSWNLILFPLWGGYFLPELTAYFILMFVVYSVYSSFTLTLTAVLSHFRIKAAQRMDWMEEVRGFGDWEKVKHIVLIMVANEPREVYEATLEGLAHQTYPTENIVPVIATEERFPAGGQAAMELQQKYEGVFGDFIVAVHPANIVGEIKGKSSNENWAGRAAKRILVDEKGWDIDYLTITSNDADAILDSRYFAYLTFKFLDDPHRYLKFWQPAIVFYKNIWKLPAATRVVNSLSGLMNLSALSRRDRLVSFSNYSASLSMIDKIGYWDTDVIPEDYRIFFKAFFALDGNVEVEPIFLPSVADAPESTSMWKTFYNDYQQKKRWAWGVSDIPLFLEMYAKNHKESGINKTLRVARVVVHHVLWPVNWFVITVGATAASFINPNFQRTSIGFALPKVTSGLMSITLLFLLVLLWVDSMQRPPRTKDVPWWKPVLAPFEFVLMPIVGFVFGALPGLDAHTRLMLGRYMEYRVTEKIAEKK